MDKQTEKAFDRAVNLVNSYYNKLGEAIDNNDEAAADKYGDRYENAIERYAKQFGYTYSQFEDACTCTRVYGYNMS